MPDDSCLPSPSGRGPVASFRHAVSEDLRDILAIEEAAFATDRLSPRRLRALLASPSADLLVAIVGDAIAGYCLVLRRRSSRVARLYSIAVRETLAGSGLGRRLLEAAESAAADGGATILRLEVRNDNPRAIRLYETTGYRGIGRRENYYQDGATALRYQRELRTGATLAPTLRVAPLHMPA
jgi:ribosomal protein S18 acetylase RimI-like enzyme